ncbi:MAG: 4-hydroxy-3-methylbut-2-enyl diphosphate reductase [Bacteroidetes bacterium]|nr:4-hydroxy-3-methylbut-2-enyl diphosphate reductase [Bacteroidota bacterium]
MEVRIESTAGFCFGVVSAIDLVEKELKESKSLYCLGDIVHNDMEVERLSKLGLKIINLEQMKSLSNCKVMIRAHGEPPSTYEIAKKNNIEIIDATCPIVLKLQKDVLSGFNEMKENDGQVVIFGKKGHAEVVGLVGQTQGNAIVISNRDDINLIDFSRPIHIFSQTTMSKDDYEYLCNEIKLRANILKIKDSICTKVSSRSKDLIKFADEVDVLLFVSGVNSSNGIYLYNHCKNHKEKTYLVSSIDEIDFNWFKGANIVGISGATSTPMWLMKEIEQLIINNHQEEK